MKRLFRSRQAHSPPPDVEDDVALLAAAAEGRVEALRTLHTRHAPWLRMRLSRRCPDDDIVDEAIQDTFLAIWNSAGRYAPSRGEPAAWMWTIAVRRLVSLLRGRGNRWIGSGVPLEDVQVPEGSVEDVVMLKLGHGDLATALQRLSPELRAALQATVLDGLTVREAAILLGIPQGTVKTRVMRAKARLREHLA
ncbi:RNA polymerase sigma factor [Sphaerisporangium sp. B11E5]|uniref:RNA polymerase sigma factor n=1 Tax=Sphaerisporangium sp. B11E5 TaxID=3153563 RepID=UPI00325CE0BE